jgi:hypothetical protein
MTDERESLHPVVMRCRFKPYVIVFRKLIFGSRISLLGLPPLPTQLQDSKEETHKKF